MGPEFFLDRCLGRSTASALADVGWRVHLIGQHFPSDGQETSDPEWIRFGVERGWALLTQDKMIRYRKDELAAVEETAGVMFILANGNLTIKQRTEQFLTNQAVIHAAAVEHGPALYRIYPDRIAKIWP